MSFSTFVLPELKQDLKSSMQKMVKRQCTGQGLHDGGRTVEVNKILYCMSFVDKETPGKLKY